MKIVYIVQRFHTNLYWRLKALAEAGHEVFVLANQEKSGERRDEAIKTIILKEPKNSGLWRWLSQRSHAIYFDIPDLSDLKARIKEIGPDVIVGRNINSLRTLAAFAFANKRKTKVFAEAQTEDYSLGGFPKNALMRSARSLFGVRGLITPLKNRLPAADPFFKYLPFVVPAADFDKSYFAGGHINIIAVGKYIARKDHFTLLKAIRQLSDSYDIKLTIIGQYNTPETEELRKQVAEVVKFEGLERIVQLEDNLPNEAMERWYRSHDLFVLPAYDEPASYSVLEAMAAKLPVIASDTCGTSCYIEEGESGYVFKSKDADDLAAKIEAVIKDKDNLIKMGEKGFFLAREGHSPAAFVREFEKICSEN
jgi:glycosyltransferase involved in cell wall biosynthesis